MVTGLLVGGATGSILTFLFAPKSGKELRTDIVHTMDSSVDKVKDTTTNIYNGARHITTDTINRIQSAINAGVSSYKNSTEKVQTSKEMIEETLAEQSSGTNI
ncbi:MAG: YtxH domain-containing protein [Syntrophothermus sp.]